MPNENAPVCACGVVVDLPKSARNSSIVPRRLTILVPKSKGGKSEGKGARKHQQQQQQQQDDGRAPKNIVQTSSETGASSTAMEVTARSTTKSGKFDKRLSHSRRTRSADRAESHYTYIDSISSILGDGIRESAIPEALYATIPDTPCGSANEAGLSTQSRTQPLYAIPSMTSPPPTYDVAIAKTRQTGLPPTYEEYLCHKSRSHTPPPPWSDSITSSSSMSSNPGVQARRELLASQFDLREYLAQLALAQSADRGSHYQHQQQSRDPACSSASQQAALREQQARAQQRARAMPPRSQSVSRAQQQRIATMYEDAAFCMETTVLQSAFDQGFALCSLM